MRKKRRFLAEYLVRDFRLHSIFPPLTDRGSRPILQAAAGISAEQLTRHEARGSPCGSPGGIKASCVGTGPRDRAGRTGAGDPKEDAARLKSDRLRRFFLFTLPAVSNLHIFDAAAPRHKAPGRCVICNRHLKLVELNPAPVMITNEDPNQTCLT